MAAPTLLNYGPGNVDETLTLTMTNLIPGIKDNVFKENTALGWLYGAAKQKKKGGTSLSHGLRYGRNTTAQSYQRYDILDTTPQDNLTRDQWDWKQYAVSVSIDGFTERIANAGQYAIENAIEEKKEEAEMSLKTLLEQDIFAAAPGSKSLRSLPTIVLASGTEGQINGTTSTWWQATVTAGGSWAGGIGRASLVTNMNTISKLNPVGMPEMLISDQTSYEAYESTMIAQYRYTDNSPDIGAKKLLFKEVPWIWSVQATSGVIYVLHSKAIEFVVNSDTDFTVTQFVKPANQDARVAQILFAATLATGIRRKLGKTTGNAA